MYKDGDYRGLSLEEVILAIHDELRENRAFLQMSLLDPDPDNRPAEDLRIRKNHGAGRRHGKRAGHACGGHLRIGGGSRP